MLLKLLIGLYILVCLLLFFFQERLLFFPQKLPATHQFSFPGNFQELQFSTNDKNLLNGLLFRADSSRGLIFYLHGNAGSLEHWGQVAGIYTNLGYDVFLLDYRGYGKSEGRIRSEAQLFDDNQVVFDALRSQFGYSLDKTIILGYSIGSGLAAKLAADNKTKALILQTPYYSLRDMMRRRFPIIPRFILKYPFQTNQHLAKVEAPIFLFHGDEDLVIPYESSLQLHAEHPAKTTMFTLNEQGHSGVTFNVEYQKQLARILNGLD